MFDKDFTDSRTVFNETIKKFVDYAKLSGSNHPDKYYLNFNKLVNSCIDIKNIKDANNLDRMRLSIVFAIISNSIIDKINAEKPYKVIFSDCKDICNLLKSGWDIPIIKITYEQLSLFPA